MTGNVRVSPLVRMREKNNSFQEKMRAKIAAATRPGYANGSAIW